MGERSVTLNVTCPNCGMHPGTPCVSSTGRRATHHHAARRRAGAKLLPTGRASCPRCRMPVQVIAGRVGFHDAGGHPCPGSEEAA